MKFAFQAGSLAIDPAVILAPMEGLSDKPLRTAIKALGGVGLTVSEFVAVSALERLDRRTLRMCAIDPTERPTAIQFYGRDPVRFGEAVRNAADLGADELDLNCGCPSRQVAAGSRCGSALMREPVLCQQIFDEIAKASSLPWSVKMRLGWDEANQNALELAQRAEEAGASFVTIHARTRMQMYKGRAKWSAVAPIADALHIPVVINGDILTPQDAVDALRLSHASGVMVGRGLLRDPWLPRRIVAKVQGEPDPKPSNAERQAFINALLDRAEEEVLREGPKLGRMKQILGYFARTLPAGQALLIEALHVTSCGACREAVDRWFETLPADAFDHKVTASDPALHFQPGDARAFVAQDPVESETMP